MKRKKYNFAHLFESEVRLIEKELLHPKIKKILKNFKINFLYEKKIYKLNKTYIIPDFILFVNNIIYIIEAKSEVHYNKICKKNIFNQSLDQIKALKYNFPDNEIKHILLSEFGTIKCKASDYSMSLNDLTLFLKDGIYTQSKQKFNNQELLVLSNKIIKEYNKKFK
jgi:hypothetical protein